MKFLGVHPMFAGDWIGIACFISAALVLAMPWWVAVPLGVLTWRAIAR